MTRLFFLIFLLSIFLFASFKVFAQSSYVLPYPSSMPGSAFYKIHLVWDKIMQYWYFGDIGRFNYSLKESDKYLVQAKTLFEYNQYLLGYQALSISNAYFIKLPDDFNNIKRDHKPFKQYEILAKSAAQKHIEVLTRIRELVPNQFIWSPEKFSPIKLNLAQAIKTSIAIRRKLL